MTFFNPKEDVLDLQLTQYGKRLLAQGKFKPSYYLFFDDGVLYDSSFAGNSLEKQNSIKSRIQDETPRLKTQYNFSELLEETPFHAPVPTPEKHFSLSSPLGTSDPLSSYNPRWKIRMFGEDSPTIESATAHLASSYGNLKIPQIDINVNFKTAVSSISSSPIINEDPNLSSKEFEDGTYVGVQPRTILMQVLEENSAFTKENFDIEVYEKTTKSKLIVSSSSDLDVWTPLVFKKKITNIVDGIYIDNPPESCHELDSSHVEYYFDIFVDNEIGEESLAAVSENLRTNNRYLKTSNSSLSSAEFEIADIYSQVVSGDACPVDPCADKSSE